MAPHRQFGGSSVAEIFIFLISNKNCPLFVKEIFFYLGCPKSYRPPQFFAQSVSSSFFWHQFVFFKLSGEGIDYVLWQLNTQNLKVTVLQIIVEFLMRIFII